MSSEAASRLERLATRRASQRAGDDKGFRLRGRWHKVALLTHILASVGWFGIAAVVAFLAIGAGATGDADLRHAGYRVLETLPWLSIPVGAAAVLTGAVLSLGTAWGFVRHWWVVAKIAIATAVIVTDAVVIASFAHDAAAAGHAAGPLRDGAIAHVVALTVATVLSVFKPRARTPWGLRKLAGEESSAER
ncbi:MAG: hypothetical protein JWL73_1912 [Actinomycetia bacterium]|nr:hypothetical protein [Actinomycetes bacterium]